MPNNRYDVWHCWVSLPSADEGLNNFLYTLGLLVVTTNRVVAGSQR